MDTAERPMWAPMLVGGLVHCLVMAGCGSDAPMRPTPQEERLVQVRMELEHHVERGLEADLPAPMPAEQVDVTEAVLHRRQVADTMTGAVQVSMAPLAVAAAFFAIDGPVDLLLAVVPIDKFGKAYELARLGFRTRKANRRAKKLIQLQDEFKALLSRNEREFLRLAGALRASERQALKVIHQRGNSAALIQTLMRRHLDRDADIRWIASKLEDGKLDRAFARRYTFDKDIVEDITEYDANIPWSTLQRVVQGKRVDDVDRDALVGKLAGLMGERVARERVDSPAFVNKFLHPGDRVVSIRGMRYARGMGGHQGSLDIVAVTDSGKAVFGEVKNWSAETWEKSWKSTLDHLRRHDQGIDEFLDASHESRTVAAKILFVRREGFQAWDNEQLRKQFESKLSKLGWRLEYLPSDDIKSFSTIIDDLR